MQIVVLLVLGTVGIFSTTIYLDMKERHTISRSVYDFLVLNPTMYLELKEGTTHMYHGTVLMKSYSGKWLFNRIQQRKDLDLHSFIKPEQLRKCKVSEK